MVNVYEEDENGKEVLVYREMNDEEFEELENREPHPELEHPLIEQVKSMTAEEKVQLRKAMGF